MHTVEWTVSELKAAGSKRAEPFAVPAPMWAPQSAAAGGRRSAFGAGTETVTLQSAFPQLVARPQWQPHAPIVFVGHGTDADSGRDVARSRWCACGPAALFGSAEQGVAARLVEGAAGVINAIEGPGNAQYVDPRFACGTAPCFIVGGNDGWFRRIGKAANAGVSIG
jgi:hypothetical protein